MDKQKQIEELTNKICSVLFIKSAQPNCSDCYFSDDCGYKVLAEELLKYYQPKIPENAVVLTREEYQKYLAFKIIEPQVRGCLDREKKLQKQVETISKKTAEKFKKLLKALVVERNCNEDYDWEDVQIDGQIFIECVDEICKEIIGEGK